MGLSIVFTLLGLAVPVGLVAVLVLAIRRRGQDGSPGTGARGSGASSSTCCSWP